MSWMLAAKSTGVCGSSGWSTSASFSIAVTMRRAVVGLSRPASPFMRSHRFASSSDGLTALSRVLTLLSEFIDEFLSWHRRRGSHLSVSSSEGKSRWRGVKEMRSNKIGQLNIHDIDIYV
jgi:hypothetical protein